MELKITKDNWWHWPFSEKELAEYQEPKRMKRRTIFFSVLFLVIAMVLFYYEINTYGIALLFGMVISWIYYLKQIK